VPAAPRKRCAGACQLPRSVFARWQAQGLVARGHREVRATRVKPRHANVCVRRTSNGGLGWCRVERDAGHRGADPANGNAVAHRPLRPRPNPQQADHGPGEEGRVAYRRRRARMSVCLLPIDALSPTVAHPFDSQTSLVFCGNGDARRDEGLRANDGACVRLAPQIICNESKLERSPVQSGFQYSRQLATRMGLRATAFPQVREQPAAGDPSHHAPNHAEWDRVW
jgi:hypothetical protein